MFWLCKVVTSVLFLQNFAFVLSQDKLNEDIASVGDLQAVVVIFRHGDRTPIQPYPNDPYKNESLWPVHFGQLTNIGKFRQYQLGQWLRKRYNKFLPENYSEKDIYIRSTDVDRTLMSAEVNLAGLYPPSGSEIWDQEIPWQPIPIHTIPEKEDFVVAAKKPCDKYNKLLKDLMKSPEFVEIRKKNHDLFAYLTRYSGTLINTIEMVEYLYNDLFIESQNNFTLPNWTNPVFPKKMKPLADLSFAIPSYTKDLARLKTGPLITEIVGHFQERVTYLSNIEEKSPENNSSTDSVLINKFEQPPIKSRKFWMYSGHDMTIANVLQSLNLFEYHCPPYASTILFELRTSVKAEYFINIYYKNSTVPQKMTLKGCDFNCPLDTFLEIVAPLLIEPKTWHNECNTDLYDFDPFTIVILVGLICFILLALFVLKICVGAITEPKEESKKYPYWRLANEEI